MGFLSKIFAPFGGGTKPGFQAYYRTEYTSTQLEMLQMGYKENSDHEIFMPDTVWIGPRSKVYHSCDRSLPWHLVRGQWWCHSNPGKRGSSPWASPLQKV